jgi:four helix bundle protein
MQDFRNLKVWLKAHQVVLAVYRITARFPREELYGLTSQIRRCAVSVPSNIAEGCGRGTDADFRRFLQIAAGSASELDYQLLLSRDLGYLPSSEYDSLHPALTEVRRMLTAFLHKLAPNNNNCPGLANS